MEDKPNFIHIYFTEFHKTSENLNIFIKINDKEEPIAPIYISKDLIKDYISSVYIYISQKINFRLDFITQNAYDGKIIQDRKIILELKNSKDDYYFDYNLISPKDFSPEIQFELFLEMVKNKYEIDLQKSHLIKLILFKNSKKLIY